MDGLKKNTRNNNQKNTYSETTPMIKIIYFIALFLLLIFIIYLIYMAYKMSDEARKNSPVIVNEVMDAYVARPGVELPSPTIGMAHSFSTWIYVKDWNYNFGKYKSILWKGNPSTAGDDSGDGNIHCPSIWLYPLTNSLKVVTSTTVAEGVESCDIQNIPLMTWVHIVYVLNNRTVDLYINGKLERSCALRGIPNITTDKVYITGGDPPGYYGKIGKTQYFTKALLPNDVASLYQQGPLGSTQYQVKFFSDGKLMNVTDKSSFTS
jgi:hypothetical protein